MPKTIEAKITHEKVVQYEDGEFIFVEGDTSRDLFIIQEGEVEIYGYGSWDRASMIEEHLRYNGWDQY